MTVAQGGTFTIGTSTAPIPVGTTAYLVLAYGKQRGPIRLNHQQRRQFPGLRRDRDAMGVGDRHGVGFECAGGHGGSV